MFADQDFQERKYFFKLILEEEIIVKIYEVVERKRLVEVKETICRII